MLHRCDAESAGLRRAQQAAEDAEAFRLAGEAIYSYLASIPDRAQTFDTPDGLHVLLDPEKTAKENAAAYFKKFKKARSGLPRVASRLVVLERNRAYWEQLLWELDRAEAASIADLAAACDEIGDSLGSKKAAKRPAARRSPPRSRTVDLGDGTTAHVGRSPQDNERVTFSVAGPDDLWFHARNVPGAHVVLKQPTARGSATEAQILAAAALAAGQSRAADAAKVEVDYTQRKHVRKHGGGRVGLVWYTDFKTVRVTPNRLPPPV
jgi:predicted ribosome quality control (RQC) complex YloA/Tae2 family protein